MKTRILLDNIRSRYNVGAIFRTADGAGVEHVYLAGRTPAPLDRFGRVDQKISKTSLGACDTVAWTHVGQMDDWSTLAISAQLEQLRNEGFAILVVEQTAASIALEAVEWPEDAVVVFGAEDEGVQAVICDQADACIELPMLGTKESLNVSVTAGIMLYQRLLSRGQC